MRGNEKKYNHNPGRVELNNGKKCQHSDKFFTRLYMEQKIAGIPYSNHDWKICTNTSGVSYFMKDTYFEFNPVRGWCGYVIIFHRFHRWLFKVITLRGKAVNFQVII